LIFGHGSAEDFPVMIEKHVCRPALLLEELDNSHFFGLEHVSAHYPVTGSCLFHSVASSGALYRTEVISVSRTSGNPLAPEFFVRRGCVLHRRKKLENIACFEVPHRIFVWMKK
jgi:hypothetical protein